LPHPEKCARIAREPVPGVIGAYRDQSPASEERFNGTFLRRHGPQILGINNIAREDTLLLDSLNQQLNRIAKFRSFIPR